MSSNIFSIQTQNLRELEKAWKQSNRLINESFRVRDEVAIDIQTKLMALLFSAYTETIFSKLIHTPHTLSQLEIDNLKKSFKKNSYAGWIMCLNLIVGKITTKDQSHHSMVINQVKDILKNYIKEPNEVRNRLAHGQWKTALNSNHTAVNNPITSKIQNLDIVMLTKYKKSFTLINGIFEDLIKSPDNAHVTSYQNKIDEFYREQSRMASWTLQDRISKLKPKPEIYR